MGQKMPSLWAWEVTDKQEESLCPDSPGSEVLGRMVCGIDWLRGCTDLYTGNETVHLRSGLEPKGQDWNPAKLSMGLEPTVF